MSVLNEFANRPFRLALREATAMTFVWCFAIGALLVVRVIGDDRSAADSRQTGTVNLSAAIALIFMVLAFAIFARRRQHIVPVAAVAAWLCAWTAIALVNNSASTETLREGVREASVVALFVIVYELPERFTPTITARLVQLVALVPAVLAIYQLASGTGMDVAGNLRAHGTLAHPNSAAMFFAVAMAASAWVFLEHGRRSLDLLLVALFSTALVATFSIDGLLTAVAMLMLYGLTHRGEPRSRAAPLLLAGLLLVGFFATPLGTRRVAGETTTNLSAAERGEANSTLGWRLNKWKTLIPVWERSPVVGNGLGVTTTTEAEVGSEYAGALPHNEYLRYLVETGVVGLCFLLWGAVTLVRRLLALRRRGDLGEGDRGVALAATLGLIVLFGCLINSLADNTLLNSPTCYVAVLLIAAALTGYGPRAKQA